MNGTRSFGLLVVIALTWQLVIVAQPAVAAASCDVTALTPHNVATQKITGPAKGKCTNVAYMTWRICLELKIPEKQTGWFTWGCRVEQAPSDTFFQAAHDEACVLGKDYLVRTYGL